MTESASVIWAVQMSTVEFHPWNSRRGATEMPDEWRIDLDPGPASTYDDIRKVAHVAHEVLDEPGRSGLPQDERQQGPPRLRTGEAGARPQGRTTRGARLRPRGRAARSRPGHHHLVEEGPRPGRGVRRLQPERPRPHHRCGVLGPRAAGRPRLHPDPLGGDRRRRPARLHDPHGAAALRRDRRPPPRHRRPRLRPRTLVGVGRSRRACPRTTTGTTAAGSRFCG
nr:hypothetical protein [Nocardioides convexus]